MGLEGFVQDTWRPTSGMTLDYGLRVAYLGPTYTTGQFLQNYFVPEAYDPVPGGLDRDGQRRASRQHRPRQR